MTLRQALRLHSGQAQLFQLTHEIDILTKHVFEAVACWDHCQMFYQPMYTVRLVAGSKKPCPFCRLQTAIDLERPRERGGKDDTMTAIPFVTEMTKSQGEAAHWPVEAIENLIKAGFTLTIAPAQGLDYFEQPTVTEFLVTTSKDGLVYGEGCQPDFIGAFSDAYMLTPGVLGSGG
jgi:hypothetical protein